MSKDACGGFAFAVAFGNMYKGREGTPRWAVASLSGRLLPYLGGCFPIWADVLSETVNRGPQTRLS